MLNENAKKWVKALRSGEFPQARGVLTQVNSDGKATGHCCLGVACELAVQDGLKIQTISHPINGIRDYDGNPKTLPESVQEWLGIKSYTAEYYDKNNFHQQLTSDNDEGKTFAEIADLIESEPKGLFA